MGSNQSTIRKAPNAVNVHMVNSTATLDKPKDTVFAQSTMGNNQSTIQKAFNVTNADIVNSTTALKEAKDNVFAQSTIESSQSTIHKAPNVTNADINSTSTLNEEKDMVLSQSSMRNNQSTIHKAPSIMNKNGINSTAILNEAKNMAPSGLDSGYSSQNATPDTSGSRASYLVTGRKTSLSQSLQKLKPKQLQAYNKHIPPLTWERFSDLREQYAESLNSFTRGLPGYSSVLMTLQVLGEDEETAEPWVFIQCDRAISKKVRNFFKQHVIKIDFEPPEPDDRSPRLRVVVYPFPPRPLAKYSLPNDHSAEIYRMSHSN